MDQFVQVDTSYKIFLSGALAALLFNFKEGIMGNIHVKLYAIWTSDSGGDVFFKDFLSEVLAVLLFSGAEPLCNVERGHHREHSCEVI